MNKSANEQQGQHKSGFGHKHMWIMAACCALPLIGFLAIGVVGVSAPSLETFLSLICVVGMVYMMFSMHRGHGHGKEGASCHSGTEDHNPVQENRR